MFNSFILNKELFHNRENILNAPINFFDLSPQAEKSFHDVGLHTVKDLINCTPDQLKSLKWVGERTLLKIAKILYSAHLIDVTHLLIKKLPKSSLKNFDRQQGEYQVEEAQLLWHFAEGDQESEDQKYVMLSSEKDRKDLLVYEGVTLKAILIQMDESLKKIKRARSKTSRNFKLGLTGLEECRRVLDRFIKIAVQGVYDDSRT